MEEERKILGYYNYTVILTYIGMIIGALGIKCSIDGNFRGAVICLMIAGLCDMFDGTIASTKDRDGMEKRFGIQIDSLCDLICFGVLPGIFIYNICDAADVSFCSAAFYILCALVRLAYFNVMEEKRQDTEKSGRKYYQGMPVTSVALIIPAVYIIENYINISEPGVYVILACIAGAAFLVPVKIKKPFFMGKIAIVLSGMLEFIMLMMTAGSV